MPKLDEWEIESLAPYFGGPLAEHLANQIPVEAKWVNRGYARIPAEDFEQEMWAYALGHADNLKQLWEEGKPGFVNRRIRDAAIDLLKEDERYVRAEKAVNAGYSVDDEQFYTTGLLAKVLPALIAADLDVAEAMQKASSGTDAAGIHIRNNDPHSGAENYQAMLMDMSAAFQRLTPGQRRLLTAYYGLSQEDDSAGRWERQQLAASMGLAEDTLRKRANRALIALQRELGGPSPWV